MEKQDKIRLNSLILIAGFVSSLAVAYLLGAHYHRSFPANTFLFDPLSQFSDETCLVSIRHDPSRSMKAYGNLLPLFYLFLDMVNVAGLNLGLGIYLTVLVAFFLIYAWRNLQGRGASRRSSIASSFRSCVIRSCSAWTGPTRRCTSSSCWPASSAITSRGRC